MGYEKQSLDTPENQTIYYPDRNRDIEEKRELAKAFLNAPSRDTFAELAAHRGFWATEAWRNIDYYVDEKVFKDQAPTDVAEAVANAISNPDELKTVHNLKGFGWPTATELLHVLSPDTYAILNKRSVIGMEALGYEPPSQKSASAEQYWEFVEAVEEATQKYGLREAVNASPETPDVPENATDFEAADSAFNAHYDDAATGFDLGKIRKGQSAGTQPEISDALAEKIEQVVAADPSYRDMEDFIHSAVRRELEHL